MPHHLLSEGELKTFCIYCKAEVPIKEWKSDWHLEMHYKTVKCSCGKDLHVKAGFEGSGHDEWNGHKFTSKITKKADGKKQNIEDKIRIVEKTKVVERKYPKMK